jgi:hypothetical protein
MQYHWSTKKSFTEDLAAHLLGNEDLYAEDFEKILAVVKTTGNQPLFDAIARIATADVEMLTDNPVFSAMTTLAVVYVRGNQKLSEMASRGYRELDDSTWSEIYNIALARAGRVPREPMTGNAIGAILQALVEGSGIRHLFDPGVLSQPDRMIRSHYGLYAMAVASILAVMTRPADGQDRRTVEVLISDVLSGEV